MIFKLTPYISGKPVPGVEPGKGSLTTEVSEHLVI
jgi:hypothetical protein